VALTRDRRPEHLAEELQLLLAGDRVGDRYPGDRAVVLAQPDRPVLVAGGAAEVACLVLVARNFADRSQSEALLGKRSSSRLRMRLLSCWRRASNTSRIKVSPPIDRMAVKNDWARAP